MIKTKNKININGNIMQNFTPVSENDSMESKEFEMDLTFERSFLPTRLSVIKMVAYVQGSVKPENFKNAVKMLAKKHALLRSRIVLREDGTAYFTTHGAKFPLVKIIEGKSDIDIFKAIHNEDQEPSDFEKDPTSRFILIKYKDENDVIISYIHHVISDGRSVAYVMKHLFQFIANPNKDIEEIEPVSLVKTAPKDIKGLKMLKGMINLFVNKKWAKEKVTFTSKDFQKIAKEKSIHKFVGFIEETLSEELTQQIRIKARKEGVSVNAALLTAILIAKNNNPTFKDLPNKIGFAVDVRNKLTNMAGEACSLLASSTVVKMKKGDKLDFWDISRDLHNQTLKNLQSNTKLFLRRVMSPMMDPTFSDAMYMKQTGDWEGTPMINKLSKKGGKIPVGGMITNLGGLMVPSEYIGESPLIIKDMVFYAPLGMEKIIELGVSSLLGKMHIIIPGSSDEKINEYKKKLLKEIREILIENLN